MSMIAEGYRDQPGVVNTQSVVSLGPPRVIFA